MHAHRLIGVQRAGVDVQGSILFTHGAPPVEVLYVHSVRCMPNLDYQWSRIKALSS